jgi:hypothetical protein
MPTRTSLSSSLRKVTREALKNALTVTTFGYFSESFLAIHPRRSIEAFRNQYINAMFLEGNHERIGIVYGVLAAQQALRGLFRERGYSQA